jgi:DNA-binding CsgD family transcriptional regulator
MSSKEIAEIAQLLPRSVDTARHRLRKKLGIETVETDLVTFLRNL